MEQNIVSIRSMQGSNQADFYSEVNFRMKFGEYSEIEIAGKSHMSLDESHESWQRVTRVLMNRMNRRNESHESR